MYRQSRVDPAPSGNSACQTAVAQLPIPPPPPFLTSVYDIDALDTIPTETQKNTAVPSTSRDVVSMPIDVVNNIRYLQR